MSLSKFKDVDLREFVLYLKRRCFSRPKGCEGCELYSEGGRCFFDHQSFLYEVEKPDGEIYKSLKLLHPAQWDLDILSEEGWDGDVIKV